MNGVEARQDTALYISPQTHTRLPGSVATRQAELCAGHGCPDCRGQSLLPHFMLLAMAASSLAGLPGDILPARRAAAPDPVEAVAAE